MSRISNEEVARIAHLARLELSANEIAELAPLAKTLRQRLDEPTKFLRVKLRKHT